MLHTNSGREKSGDKGRDRPPGMKDLEEVVFREEIRRKEIQQEADEIIRLIGRKVKEKQGEYGAFDPERMELFGCLHSSAVNGDVSSLEKILERLR